ncbi:MAG: SRPBCC family protein [Ginsengibacter sp.]
MQTDSIVIERTLNAPVKKVWEAMTDNDQMRKWYFDISSFKPQVGFEFQFEGGSEQQTYVHLCKITEIIPEEKLQYSWRYAGYQGNSLVTFELFPEGERTRIKLTHEGVETFPEGRDFSKESFTKGWNHIIGKSLKDFVEK